MAVGLLSGCGLPSNLVGLAAPGGALTGSIPASLFTFINTPPDPSYTLLGFEVYYKLYDNTGGQLPGTYITDTSQFTAATYATPGYAPLVSEGYQRLAAFPAPAVYSVSSGLASSWTPLSSAAATTLQQPPMIPISSGDRPNSFPVDINFSSSLLSTTQYLPAVTAQYQSGTSIVFANGSTTLYAGRLLVPTLAPSPISGSYYLKGFNPSSSFDKYDPDMQAILSSNPTFSGTSMGVGLVVLAYGLDPNVLTVYSIPVPIGYFLLTSIAVQQ